MRKVYTWIAVLVLISVLVLFPSKASADAEVYIPYDASYVVLSNADNSCVMLDTDLHKIPIDSFPMAMPYDTRCIVYYNFGNFAFQLYVIYGMPDIAVDI